MIENAACGSAGEDVGQRRRVVIRRGKCGEVQGRRLGFGAEQVRGADLSGRCAEHEGGCDPARVGDAACRDHRYADSIDDLRHESHRAGLPGHVRNHIIGQKDAAVTAGVNSLTGSPRR